VQTSLPFWRPAAIAGWLVAAPQSSQAVWKDAYVWDDLDVSREQVLHHYQTILNRYAVDLRRTVLAGHSMGGEVAVWLALTGALPAAGFLAFGPGGSFMDNPSQWQPVVSEAVARLALADAPFRGYIVYGDQDRSINPEGIHTLASALEAEGLPCPVEILPGTGHDFDPKFESTLLRALAFISPETVE
jgi:predicted esterase